MTQREISKAVIRRLPRYYRYLGDLLADGTERISSKDLSRIMKVTASQIRQDLNNFGGFGQQGYGYNVEYLHEEIGKILGIDDTHEMILAGVGNFGHTLAKFFTEGKKSSTRRFRLSGLFDIDPSLEGKEVAGIPVRMLDELPAFLENRDVEIGILTVPTEAAASVAEFMVENGVRAIWNYAHIDLKLPESVVVENVHLLDSLMTLSYDLKELKKKEA
ncbi:MAG: redox-sensing transcriptional repressor Rex [Lachnospiraceae bacterium]|nr:redox-sensing transcriptional repressor Rex [Lachnospiraceae bacterium]